MRARNRFIAVAMAAALMALLPGTALAEGERDDAASATHDRPTDRAIDRPTDKPTDRPSDRPSDKPTDKPTDRPTDRCIQRLIDRRCVDDKPKDRPIDRCLAVAENDRRCVTDHPPHDINIRKLIWRLIHAHEWEKLIRLLHWLGWL